MGLGVMTTIGRWFGGGVVVWALLGGLLAGCGGEDSGVESAGVEAGTDQALLSAKSAVDDAAEAVGAAERRVADFDEVAGEYARLSAELEAKQAEQARHQATVRELDKQYRDKGLVLPRAARRRSIEAQGGLNILQREIPLLREQLSIREPMMARRAEALAELERARAAQAEAEAALAGVER